THRPPTPSGERRSLAGRRSARMDACPRRSALVRRLVDAAEAVVARPFDEHKGFRLPGGDLDRHWNPVWPCAGAATGESGREQRDEERGTRGRWGYARTPSFERARRS